MLDNESRLTCPVCSVAFAPARSNQRYCCRACQMNASRSPRTSAKSATARRRSAAHYERAMFLAERLYSHPPALRLGFMAEIIEHAREHDANLRSLLTDPVLLRASRQDRGLFWRRAPDAYRTIAQAANAYCKRFWGHSVSDVVNGRVPEPESGEVISLA